MRLLHSVEEYLTAYPVIELIEKMDPEKPDRIERAFRYDLARQFSIIERYVNKQGANCYMTRWMGQGTDPMAMTILKSNQTIYCDKIFLFVHCEKAFRAGISGINFLYRVSPATAYTRISIRRFHSRAVYTAQTRNVFPGWRTLIPWESPTCDIGIYATTSTDAAYKAKFAQAIIRRPTASFELSSGTDDENHRATRTALKAAQKLTKNYRDHIISSRCTRLDCPQHAPDLQGRGRSSQGCKRSCKAVQQHQQKKTKAAGDIASARRKVSWIFIPIDSGNATSD
jgi:hypothetical protein